MDFSIANMQEDLRMFHFFGYRSFEPEYETMKKMRERGIRTIPFMVSNNNNFMGSPYTHYQPTWVWEREYDFTKFDQNVHDILAAVPDAELIIVLDLNPPAWWLRRGIGRRFDPFSEFGRVAALEEYRADVADYLQAILRHAVETFPDRFKAVVVMGGMTTEWFDCSRGTESPSRIEAWQKWRKDHGRPVISVPAFEERYSGVPESDGLLRTPATHADVLDYWKFNSEMSAETVSFFLRKAREVLPGKIGLTLCYGYVFELWPRALSSWAQLEYERIFDLPEVDFAAEPISYGAGERAMGGSPISMIPMQTLKARGKNIMNSIDTTTFTSRFPKAPGNHGAVPIMGRKIEWDKPEVVRAGIRREMCFNLINGCSTWYFDMWGGWYDSEAAQDALRECREIYEREIEEPRKDAFEALLVVDPENMYLINDDHCDAVSFVKPVRHALRDSGVTYTTASLRDLKLMDLSDYKAVIFCHPFDLDNGKLEFIRERCQGKTLIWIYGPGIIHNGKWDPAHVREVCGFEFGGEAIREDGKSIYIPAPKKLTADDMREILRRAGAHVWCENAEAIVYASSDLTAVHIGSARNATVKFPRIFPHITELFSGREYSNKQEITINADGPVTLLFQH